MIKIITGRQTDPLQEKILEQAVANYKQHPEYETFIIVPNHIKFTTEIKAINKLAISEQKTVTSVKNLQVLSFSRLAWYFLKDAEEGLPTQLDDAAGAMLLAKIISQKKDELLLFRNVTVNSGLVKQLYNTILQFHSENVDFDDFNQTNLTVEAKNKIHDLRIIYYEFMEQISGKFSTKNEVELQLNTILNKRDLSKMSFYFTDFSHFTPQENLTLQLLMRHAKDVTFAFKTKVGSINPNTQAGEYDYVIQQTIKKITDFLDAQKSEYTATAFPVAPKQSSREVLNTVWINGNIAPNRDLKQIQLIKADSRYAEAYFVARTIYQQVALSNYRYKDFLILAPNLHEYETYLIPILRQNKIPFFNDLQQEMKYHPLVVLIENIAQLIKRPLQTQNIITILKTRLLIPSWYQDEAAYLHDVDELENFVLAHGINHQYWHKNFDDYLTAEVIRLDKMPEEVAKIDKLRNFIITKLTKLLKELKNESDSRRALTIFFNFLTDNGVPKRLEQWRDVANDYGDLQQAQQPEQLWNLLIQLLRDYLLINPKEFEINGFFEMLNTSFREANFSQIPSTLDAVNLSEIGMVQNSGYKQVFIIGANSGNLPNIQKTPSFLSSENLEKLSQALNNHASLEDAQKLNNLDQNYQFGLALALAEKRVYLSYPVLNAANEQLEPSLYYERLKALGANELTQHDLPERTQDILSFITNSDASLGYLAYLNTIEPSKAVTELLAITKKHIPEKTEKVLAASDFDNTPKDLGPDLAQNLYGQNLNSSVSQLETFYQNSYEYFLTYGLRLHRRFENELDVIQAGNYFHETFDRLVKELNQQHLDLAQINQQELGQLLITARQKMQEEGKYAQLMTDPFNQFLFKCLDQTTSKVAYNWHRSLKQTPLRAKYSELSFGLGEKVQGLSLEVPDLAGKHVVDLRGKMDRVDLAPMTEHNQVLAQVIDYKSSAKNFDLGLFYHGIALQMVSYLDVLSRNGKFFAGQQELSLLGAFYQTVTRQLERLNSSSLFDAHLNLKESAIDSKPQLMYTGLIANDPELLDEAEPLLNGSHSTSSQLYKQVKTKKDGDFSLPKDRNFSEDEIKLLLDYDEYLIKEASHQILSGKIELNPYRYGKSKNALTYSDYRDIFFFDAMLRQNQYHEIDKLSKKELLTQIKAKLQKED
ncbi:MULTISPECIES: PD-(D/E)XK nuclease family protein [Lactobacillus]|uniref:ATP-dependent helicase/deoxyribonuclease subunit B n=1 Tax=Lactobacillus xujianguonis TaxID=2495899 RepID=A0A437SY39_9LACO|nr:MULTISPECIES: PD-(D/E)XK nuclease family protein [Lactobacillus]RVU71727.1 ATP-dependent helicase [Lactobacillus xujianguonis]RVU77557.1 ATP-dependent helicase [Lactobacillus xujianguonis]